MTWDESIAQCDTREEAREKFHEWCEMKENVFDEIDFIGRTNDVATFHVYTGNPVGQSPPTNGNHVARNLMTYYSIRGRNPLRVIDLNGVDEGVVEVKVLLAELKLH